MLHPIVPYPLPANVREQLLAMAADSDLLILGEIHGTQEVPRIVLGLLKDLEQLNYAGLGVEIPGHFEGQVLAWVKGEEAEAPPFFGPAPVQDGRGNLQVASMLQQAVGLDWRILCFDVSQRYESWAERDDAMAENLLRQWEETCPGRKVVAVCGNAHSCLAASPWTLSKGLWPSFAYKLQQSRPAVKIASVEIVFHSGTFFNMQLRKFGAVQPPLVGPGEFRTSANHTAALHLPRATAATFVG